MEEHEHEWAYATDMAAPTPEPGYIVTNDQPIIRFCIHCDARQSLSPVGLVAEYHRKNLELEQQVERLRTRDAEWTESNAKAVTRYAEARWLLEEVNEGFAPMMQRCCFCDASYDYPSADESTMEHADTCPIVKIRAFLSK